MFLVAALVLAAVPDTGVATCAPCAVVASVVGTERLFGEALARIYRAESLSSLFV